MYDVYIKNYKSGNSIVTTETKIFGVPLNDDTIGFPVSRPNVKGSEDNADSFDFSMENTSPYYDSFLELKTLLRVEYDGDTIFDGRVLTIDGSTIYQTKTVHCEGSFGYMNDSQYEGIQEKRKSKITWSEYYNRLINNHNTMVGTDNPEKVITRGTVTIDGSTTFTPTTETRQYEPSSWTKTSSLISSLVSEFGGHIRTRYQNGTRYLDWYKYYARDLGANRPTVEVGVNIVDLSTSDSNIDNLFTYCIPIGASNSNGEPVYVDGYVYTDKNGNQHTHSGKAVPVSIIRDLYTDLQLNDDFHNASDYSSAKANYGSIYRPENFGGAKTKEQLWNFMKEWMKNCYFGLATSFTVRGYDIHITDPTKAKILVGDCVNVKYYIVENGVKTFVTKRLVCKAVTYDLFNPENNSYTFGIPGEILKRTYSEGRKSASEQLTGGPGGGGGGDDKNLNLTFEGVAEWIRSAAGQSSTYGGNDAMNSFLAYGRVYGSAKVYDPDDLPTGDNISQHPELKFEAELIGKITHTNQNIYVAYNKDRGLFAFIGGRSTYGALPITFWYYHNKKNGITTYTNFSATYSEEDQKILNIAKDWGVQLQNDDDASNFINTFKLNFSNGVANMVGTVVNKTTQTARNAITAIWGENAANTLFGLNGPDSKLEVSTNADNTDSKKIVIDAAAAAINLGSVVAGSLSPKVLLDGLSGKAKVGKKQNDAWEVLLNETITYEDDQGVTRTEPGFVVCNDINVPSIPSFKTKLAIVDTLIANTATIGQLNAAIARITTLEADAITAQNLKASIANITSGLVVNGGIVMNGVLQNSGGIYAPDVYFGTADSPRSLKHGLLGGKVELVQGSTDTYHIVGYDWDGNEIAFSGTFRRAGGSSIGSSGWSEGTYSVKDTNDHVLVSTALKALVPTGNVSKSGKFVSRTIDVRYGPDEDHLYSTGFDGTAIIDASSVYDDGWAAAVAKLSWPSSGTVNNYISIGYPPSTVDGSALSRIYSILNDGNNAVKLSSNGNTYARFEHGKYDAGWEAARAKVEFPIDGSTASMSIKYPPSTVDGSAVTRTYTLSNDGDNAVKLTGGGYTVAKLTHNKYTAGVTDGKNAVGLTISTSDAKIKRNQSSNALTEVSIVLDQGSIVSQLHETLGYETKGTRTLKVKANTTDLLVTTLSDYKNGYNAGATYAGGTAWFGYTSSRGSSSQSSFIDISTESTTRYLYCWYRNGNGSQVNKTNVTWYLPKAILFQNVSKGSTNEELSPNTYICVGYSRGGYSGDYKESGHTYHVPAASHSSTSVTSDTRWHGQSEADVLDRMGISSFNYKFGIGTGAPYWGFKATGCGGTKTFLVYRA